MPISKRHISMHCGSSMDICTCTVHIACTSTPMCVATSCLLMCLEGLIGVLLGCGQGCELVLWAYEECQVPSVVLCIVYPQPYMCDTDTTVLYTHVHTWCHTVNVDYVHIKL